MQLSKIRGAANGKVRLASGAISRRISERCESVTAKPGEARAPKTIIQEGKKGFGGLMIIFMEIRAVTEFWERYRRGGIGEFSGTIGGIKWPER
jgi:hypothetical protein